MGGQFPALLFESGIGNVQTLSYTMLRPLDKSI